MTEKKLGETMGRGDFFKWGLQSVKEKTIETALKSLNNVDSLVALTEEKWEKVAFFDQLSERPKSIFLKGLAFYLVSIGEDIKAYKAVCPTDGKPVQWQEHMQSFYCLHCKSFFSRGGQTLRAETDGQLQECKVKIEEGIVYITLN